MDLVNLQEEFVEIQGLEMMLIALKSQSKFKMVNFLVDLGYGSKRNFCPAGHDKCAYQISLFDIKFKGGGLDFEIL